MKEMIGLSVFALAAVGFFVMYVQQFLTNLASKRWPNVEGNILSAEIVKEGGHGNYSYVPNVTYSYRLDDIAYSGDISDTAIGNPTSTLAKAQITQYSVSKPVTIYYAPNNHEKSTLHPSVSRQTIGGLLLSGILSAVLLSVAAQSAIKLLNP